MNSATTASMTVAAITALRGHSGNTSRHASTTPPARKSATAQNVTDSLRKMRLRMPLYSSSTGAFSVLPEAGRLVWFIA